MPRRRRPSQIHPERVSLLTSPTHPRTPVILGKGTFGTVYAGILDSVHPIALKTTNPYPHLSTLPLTVQSAFDAHARHNAEAKRQLHREELALYAAKRSPGVVRLYGVCQGGLILERLHTREIPGDTIGRIRFCAEVATVITGLHRLGISHGDIKLGNVMFSNGVKFIDFGLACVKDCEEMIGRGSGAYLAPEGWGHIEGLDARIRVDVYALGMLIYEVFNGFPWKDVDAVTVRVLNGERPQWHNGDERVRAVVQRCWLHDPEKRPSAEWVVENLRLIERSLVAPIGPILFKFHHKVLHHHTHLCPHKEQKESPNFNNLVTKTIPTPKMDEPDVQVDPRSVNPYITPAQQNAQDQLTAHLVPQQQPQQQPQQPPQQQPEQQPEQQPQQETVADTDVIHEDDHVQNVDQIQEEDVVQHVTEEYLPEEGGIHVVAEGLQEEEEEEVQEVHELDEHLEPQPQFPRPSSSGYLPERENASSSTSTTKPATPAPPAPPAPQKRDYPFKQQIEANDLRSLIQVLNNSHRDPHQATLVLEAITVLLVTPPNPDLFSPSLMTLSALTSRNTTPRFAKAACLVIHRLATNPTPATEKALRISAGYDILATALRRHPTDLPVVLTATTAIHALASSSPPQCAIIVEQGAPAITLRSLSRASRTFKNDLPIASASLQALDVMSRQHAPRLIAEGAVEAITSTMGSYSHAQIDRLALPTLILLCSDEEGRRRGVNGVGAIAGAMTRKPDQRILIQTYILLAELAKEKAAATNAFSGSTVVEAVLRTLDENVNSDERIVQAGFECLTGMSRLGGDICGSLEIMQVFDLVYNLVNSRPEHRYTALGAAVFLNEILKELRNSSHPINMDLPFSLLVQLQERWPQDPVIMRHVKSAIRILREATGRRGPARREQEPKSSLRSFVKRFSTRKSNSLGVGGSAG